MDVCYYCLGKFIADDPPVTFCHKHDPDIIRYHHNKCLINKLLSFEQLFDDMGQIMIHYDAERKQINDDYKKKIAAKLKEENCRKDQDQTKHYLDTSIESFVVSESQANQQQSNQ